MKRKETIRLLTALITITFVLTIGAVSTGNAAPSKRSNPRVETARKLNRGLAGSPMANLGWILEREAHRTHVSPYLMAAAAATESSLGRAGCSGNTKNVWGLASCGGGWHVPYFNSWDEAIHFYADFLRSHWPTATSTYLSGYAACNQCWADKTAWWMSRLFGVGPAFRYP